MLKGRQLAYKPILAPASPPLSGVFKIRYQTLFVEKNGSGAAPTAGLHFTTATFIV